MWPARAAFHGLEYVKHSRECARATLLGKIDDIRPPPRAPDPELLLARPE
jgi:hypothetical protein